MSTVRKWKSIEKLCVWNGDRDTATIYCFDVLLYHIDAGTIEVLPVHKTELSIMEDIITGQEVFNALQFMVEQNKKIQFFKQYSYIFIMMHWKFVLLLELHVWYTWMLESAVIIIFSHIFLVEFHQKEWFKRIIYGSCV